MTTVRLGAVGYLNARPLVYGLDRSARWSMRADVPSRCAALLHEGAIDVGMIPSIEYLRAPAGTGGYRIVPDLAIASRGPVASVALYTTRQMADVRSIALDTSSRTSVALVTVLCAKLFGITPSFTSHGPDLRAMLARADAALIIGDNALFLNETGEGVAKVDLGEAWATLTGLPFVYAVWAGRAGALGAEDVRALQAARDAGVAHPDDIAADYCPGDPGRQAIAAQYLRDNIKYYLADEEQAGLERFYRYAVELGLVTDAGPLAFF